MGFVLIWRQEQAPALRLRFVYIRLSVDVSINRYRFSVIVIFREMGCRGHHPLQGSPDSKRTRHQPVPTLTTCYLILNAPLVHYFLGGRIVNRFGLLKRNSAFSILHSAFLFNRFSLDNFTLVFLVRNCYAVTLIHNNNLFFFGSLD